MLFWITKPRSQSALERQEIGAIISGLRGRLAFCMHMPQPQFS